MVVMPTAIVPSARANREQREGKSQVMLKNFERPSSTPQIAGPQVRAPANCILTNLQNRILEIGNPVQRSGGATLTGILRNPWVPKSPGLESSGEPARISAASAKTVNVMLPPAARQFVDEFNDRITSEAPALALKSPSRLNTRPARDLE